MNGAIVPLLQLMNSPSDLDKACKVQALLLFFREKHDYVTEITFITRIVIYQKSSSS
jgi:hypothetical protein